MPRLCRTFQTAPAAVPREDSAKYLRSGLTAEGFALPDWLVPDLEDGTAPEMKDAALENTVELLPEYAEDFAGELWPRVQWGYDSERDRDRGREEIETLVREIGEEIDGVVVPKVGRVEDVRRASEAVAGFERDYGVDEGSIELSVIVETARAVSDLPEIARLGDDGRLSGLVFGPVDYTAELGGREFDGSRPVWPGLLERLSNEASAADLVAVGGPFDQLFEERAGVTFYNGDAYADQVEREAAVGLDGSWSLHPNQTEQANRIHMPRPEELRRDVGRIEAFQDAKSGGTGAVSVDGQMIDEATFKNFANTVETVRAIHETRPRQTAERFDDALLERALALDTAW
ncbi:beta-methylmalyl-CoA/(S)-malyl-CoA lyase [Natronoarchaeum philippinense]|uniref:Beta-methylmalyl-CoA/(S)-malyl-CoA lyase n=1 Tax=Natronoarchaeum philippinense TaxID=558529 RepID=A0A285N5Q2_NATPI|nr:L-malyl-CoA/beta-methylmalyl-CoA lyase [Natronoarchaeum philippinense]SNZ04197.1 beta-methylmalyl-CoA/(S)-malyl-CoA lyase [Natronoarchaeum philippinense]